MLGEEVLACREEMHRSRGRAGLIYHRAVYFLPLVSKVRAAALSVRSELQPVEGKMDSESQSVVSNECVQRWDDLTLWLSRNVGTRGKKKILSVLFRAVAQ